MFKFNLDQVVYFMLNNEVYSSKIVSRMIVENAHDDWACTEEQKEMWQPCGPSTVKYATVHGLFDENILFESKEALLSSL